MVCSPLSVVISFLPFSFSFCFNASSVHCGFFPFYLSLLLSLSSSPTFSHFQSKSSFCILVDIFYVGLCSLQHPLNGGHLCPDVRCMMCLNYWNIALFRGQGPSCPPSILKTETLTAVSLSRSLSPALSRSAGVVRCNSGTVNSRAPRPCASGGARPLSSSPAIAPTTSGEDGRHRGLQTPLLPVCFLQIHPSIDNTHNIAHSQRKLWGGYVFAYK